MYGEDQQQYVNSLTNDGADQNGQASQATSDSPAFTTSAPTTAPTNPVASVADPQSFAPLDVKADSDELLSIKQEALQELSPLVSHLEQSPEEKFKTTMMMIQASDDQSLVKEAYAAAKQIPDEKARAQALLDIVNEINYFTQHHNS
jgi:hypothetical protein